MLADFCSLFLEHCPHSGQRQLLEDAFHLFRWVGHISSEQQIGVAPPPQRQAKPDPDEWIRRLGKLPLMYQPGERWLYGTGYDVLSVLIARVCGQPLETFLRERIFEPFGMKDTGFSVPADKLDWLASCYIPNPATGALELFDGIQDSRWSRPPIFPSGADGPVSTLDDYLAFGQMMLSGAGIAANACCRGSRSRR